LCKISSLLVESFLSPGVQKSPFPNDLRYRCDNSVRTNVLHYEKKGKAT